jgi:hypothetical protein
MIEPSDNLSPNQLFDAFCVNDRVKTLKNQIIEKLVNEDLRAWALQHKQRFEEIPPYPLDRDGIENKFGKQAEAEAWKIIEAERKLLAQKMASHIRTTCNSAISQLNNIVWTRDEHGKAVKHKWFIEEVPNTLSHSKDASPTMDIHYVGDHDSQTLERINRIGERVTEFSELIPYCDAETQQLYGKAIDLCHLERVEVAKEKKQKEKE